MQLPLLFGESEFWLRSISVLFGLALLSVVYAAAYRFYNLRTAITAVLILLTGNLFVGYMTKLNTDIPYSFFVFTGVVCWILSYKKSGLAWISGLLLGLAVLEKGLSVTPYIAALFFTLFIDLKKQYVLNFGKLLLAFLITILPWHLYQYVTNGNAFLQVYFFEHIIKRATQPVEFHYEGRLFYTKLLWQNFMPWIIFGLAILAGIVLWLRKHPTIKEVRLNIKKHLATTVFILVFTIVFISISNARPLS